MPRKRLVRHVGQCGAAPQIERRTKTLERVAGIAAVEQPPALVQEPHEALRVELVVADLQHVSGWPGHENLVLAPPASRLEELAEIGDVALEHVRSRFRGRLTPDLVDQPVGTDYLVRVEDEQRKDGPLLCAAERQERPVRGDL